MADDRGKKHARPLETINPLNLQHNLEVLSYFRTFVAVIAGTVIGILGVEGWSGFLPHVATQLLCVFAMYAKGASVKEHFHSWSKLWLHNVFSSITLLSYMLFWMIFYNIAHVFA
mmetsp:Transcript_30913/g.91969  ORF Transcript_30913/g.91969 Transcript_30913/m.91969 type:complete len:115 (-) Transcript_30913:49-393(-)